MVAVRKSEKQPIPRMLDRKLHEYRSAAGGSMNHSSDYVHADLTVLERRVCICGWPTDTISIDFNGRNYNYATSENKTASITHTLLLFIPGNPGVIQWYTLFLTQIVQKLGRGFAVRGLSYAGHGVGDDVVGTTDDHDQRFHRKRLDGKLNEAMNADGPKDMRVPWTMEGQIYHKIEWIDNILRDWRSECDSEPNLIFVTHSIGAHFAQSLLLRRPDILAKTKHVIHLMPFIRFDPPPMKKRLLSSTAHAYEYTIPMMTVLVRVMLLALPRKWIDSYLKQAGMDCTRGREIAMDIFLNPKMVKNHLELGLQEIRELPEYPNDVALRLMGDKTSTSILFCGKDHWAPEFHMEDLRCMKSNSKIPCNVHTEYIEELTHDFIVHLDQVDQAVSFCVERTKCCGHTVQHFRSRL